MRENKFSVINLGFCHHSCYYLENQPQRIIVVESDEGIAKIKECIHCPARYGLPCRRCEAYPEPRKLPPGQRAYQLGVIKTITT